MNEPEEVRYVPVDGSVCLRCGAMVHPTMTLKHRRWHEAVDPEAVKRMAEEGR